MSTRRFADLFYNAITYLGVVITLLVFIAEVFLFVIDFFSSGSNLYLGLVTYIILPAFLFFGLTLIPVGVIWKKRRLVKGALQPELRALRIDLALPAHRNALLVFIVGTAILVLMSLVGSYQAYHYTESVAFCGTLCHKVMAPEYTTYLKSPHGKVACVDCHIGPGADWFVKSKLSGARQVIRVLAGTYERPIATPVRALRPAQETCLQCHWPGKFFGTLDLKKTYYLPEKENQKWLLRMNLDVGGGEGGNYGLHAHMNLNRDIYFAQEDARRQKLTWVKSVDPKYGERVYVTKDSAFKDSAPAPAQIRKMDCIDCHNRPSHRFQTPNHLVNTALETGRMDPSLPFIKEQAVTVLAKEYASTDDALESIQKDFLKYYSALFKEALPAERRRVDDAITAAKDIYSENIFPAMKARWDVHPDNIGHLDFKGCFRCHDSKHRAADGSVITRECESCHVFIAQGPEGAVRKNLDGLEFEHPDGGDEWRTTQCTQCHSGAIAG